MKREKVVFESSEYLAPRMEMEEVVVERGFELSETTTCDDLPWLCP
jgi:hypothetical protein